MQAMYPKSFGNIVQMENYDGCIFLFELNKEINIVNDEMKSSGWNEMDDLSFEEDRQI